MTNDTLSQLHEPKIKNPPKRTGGYFVSRETMLKLNPFSRQYTLLIRMLDELHFGDVVRAVPVLAVANKVRCKLQERFGYDCCGTVPEGGLKYVKYHDILTYRLKVQRFI